MRPLDLTSVTPGVLPYPGEPDRRQRHPDTSLVTHTPSTSHISWHMAAALPAYDFTVMFQPAYDCSWTEAVGMLLEHPADRETITVLRAAARTGNLTTPVTVTRDEDTGAWHVSNGMHRVAACLLENLPVAYLPDDQVAGDDLPVYEVSLTVIPDENTDVDMLFDEMTAWLRAFPLPDGTWVESPVMGSETAPAGHLIFRGYYELDQNSMPYLLAAVRQRCAHIQPLPRIHDVSVSLLDD